MSAIKSNFRLWGPILLAFGIAPFVARAEAKELGSPHIDDCLVAPNSPAPQGRKRIAATKPIQETQRMASASVIGESVSYGRARALYLLMGSFLSPAGAKGIALLALIGNDL